nr:Testis-expressed sequence 10 protein [Ipomoea batatas]GME21575.1 Testis-expressed sequence 10 protein [Ipomoea batatas]
MLLKDYLMDELSSCSSNGFRSYPRRRECCTTVRLLLEADLGVKPPGKVMCGGGGEATRVLIAGKPAPTAGVVSALQKASKTVLNAVKSLQFSAAGKSAKQSKPKKAILSRRFSRKLLKRSFKKKTIDRNEIERWKVYNQLMEKKSNNPSSRFSPAVHNVADSNASTSETNSWSDSDFTISDDSLQSSSCSSDVNSTEAQNDAVAAKCSPTDKSVISKKVGVTTSNATTTYSPISKKQVWSNEEKEQFSPVSVLDCPFEDEDDVSSPFEDKLTNVEESETDEESPLHHYLSLPSTPADILMADLELKAAMFLNQVKARTLSRGLKPMAKTDRLLLDFFRHGIIENRLLVRADNNGEYEYDGEELMRVAEDWISGKSHSFLYEWELEAEVFTSLVNELVDDLCLI